jgi:hypothetical protein
MQFLKELQEARMTRNHNNQRMLTYSDCRERAYLILLMLQIMRFHTTHSSDAKRYAYKTVMYRDYIRFRVDGTDLYNLFYFITGDDSALSKLKDPGAASKERNLTSISVGKLNGYLRRIGSGEDTNSQDFEILALLEKELKINNSDYKELRRRLAVYTTQSYKERKITVTRLLFAARAKLSDSDFLHVFSRLALDNNLEDFTKTSPETDPSIDDLNIPLTDVKNYRFLVGAERLPYIAKFLENGLAGKTIVANFVKSYLPILIMIDDIVKAGPAHIEQLKQLHRRAKRDRLD